MPNSLPQARSPGQWVLSPKALHLSPGPSPMSRQRLPSETTRQPPSRPLQLPPHPVCTPSAHTEPWTLPGVARPSPASCRWMKLQQRRAHGAGTKGVLPGFRDRNSLAASKGKLRWLQIQIRCRFQKNKPFKQGLDHQGGGEREENSRPEHRETSRTEQTKLRSFLVVKWHVGM